MENPILANVETLEISNVSSEPFNEGRGIDMHWQRTGLNPVRTGGLLLQGLAK
jgi:hypothetical protein